MDGLVTIVSSAFASPLVVVARGKGWVAVRWAEIVVIGVYFSPNKSISEFQAFLHGLSLLIRQVLPLQTLVAGDFNAKSRLWGCPLTEPRGQALEEWALSHDLLILNQGSVETCVRWNGGSIIDLTLASHPIAHRIHGWRVLEEVETASDHRYIRFDVSTFSGTNQPARCTPQRKWVLGSMDREAMIEASIVQAWLTPTRETVDVEEEVEWFRNAMTQICDSSMSRAKARPPRRQVYWWTQEIADLRSSCMAARRQYTRLRRRRLRDVDAESRSYGVYRERLKGLRSAINTSKSRAHKELLETLSRDPWGRPYKEVRRKIRPWTPPLTETLEPRLLEDVVSALFPNRTNFQPPVMRPPQTQAETENVPPVSEGELWAAVLKLKAKNKAPGPDGVPGKAWVVALDELGNRFRRLLDTCLGTGHFPKPWKTGKLVLLRKDGRSADSPSAYRPIVLLDEADKLFERIIAGRLIQHLENVGPNLSHEQFGFRAGRSTIDAIKRVKALSDEAVSRGGVMVAVSLDIANAFNTIPWASIEEALKYHEVPPYLFRIIGSYLSERFVSYFGREGRLLRREMSCGVPQGSALGPILWNIGYDWTLRGALNPGASVTCYADDTLVTARGKTYEEASHLATNAVKRKVEMIEMLGLRVGLEKSEIMVFHGPRKAPPRDAHIIIRGVRIEVKPTMKYLGLYLDARWNFREHFALMVPRLMGAAGVLKRLLPNVGGPKTASRRLYLGVVRSMALYGAPIWMDALNDRTAALLRRPQRAMAISVVRGYRTVSGEAACLLAGSLPWDLEAEIHANMYMWRLDLRNRGQQVTWHDTKLWKVRAWQHMVQKWKDRLAHPKAGHCTVEAIQPVLQDWLNRPHGSLTFRLVQVLTGHGCFGKYLCRIAGREPNTMCHHCGCEEDTAQHTLVDCPAWADERRVLIAAVGSDLSLPALINSMLGCERSWEGVVSFCEQVMFQKETAERDREILSDLPMRQRRPGRRRRIFHALLRPP